MQSNVISDTIKYDSITKIEISTCMTAKPEKIGLEAKQWNELIARLKSYHPKNGKENDVKGWEYYIVIEQDSNEHTYISLIDNQMKINQTVYEISDYSSSDLLYLFNETILD